LSASNAISGSKKTARGGPSGSEPCSSSTAERFSLSGPSLILDPLIHAYRDDIADIALAGLLFAPHYARPVTWRCGPAASPVRLSPRLDSEPVTELAAGDEFAVLDIAGEWVWGYRRADHRVGYVPTAAFND
jgi:hypothetical protein